MNPDLARLFIAYRRGEISYDEYMQGVTALSQMQPQPQEPTGYQSPSAPPPSTALDPQTVQMARDVMESRLDRARAYDQPYAEDRMTRAMPSDAPMPQAMRQPMPQTNELTVQKAPERQINPLMQFIRGDFREGADQRIMDAMRRQQEESGVPQARATGGAAESKKSSRDDVLSKALDIIHAMLTRR